MSGAETGSELAADAPASTAGAAGTRQDVLTRVLDAALQAERSGAFREMVRQHPRATQGLVRRHERLIRSTSGDALPDDPLPVMARWLLRWLVAQLRPDGEGHLDGIPDAAWLHLTAWRPALAVAAVAGFVAVPDFPRQYRRRSGEPALENLCGLWNLGQSTVYRLIERARRQMAQTALEPLAGPARRLSLRAAVLAEVRRQRGDLGDVTSPAWHEAQADRALRDGDAASALWHLWRAGAWEAFARTLEGRASELATSPETDALVLRVAAHALPPRAEVELCLGQAALARSRGSVDGEQRALERARQVAQLSKQPLLQAIAQGALGKFHRLRDADRATACYQDAVECLRHHDSQDADPDTAARFVSIHGELAWLYLQRNDERARGLLDLAENLRGRQRVPDAVLGTLEGIWAEYWRRSGDHAKALEHRFRALAIFERVGERRLILSAYLNLSVSYNNSGEPERAIPHAELVLSEAQRGGVQPETVVNAHLTLGTAHFLAGRLDRSIAAHAEALALSLRTDLRLQRLRARYNLAEAYYTRFRDQGDAADEQVADGLVAAELATPESDTPAVLRDAVRRLKAQVLGATPPEARAEFTQSLLPAELTVHGTEWAEVQQQRQALSIPAPPDVHARAHLAIARAYTAIAAKEREAALALIHRHGLRDRFVAELDALRQTFERELTREQQLAATWKQAAPDLVDDSRRAALIAQLLKEGAVNKSAYGEICGVAPATASKHLGLLAERGLLVQRGKGPATRYELPTAAA